MKDKKTIYIKQADKKNRKINITEDSVVIEIIDDLKIDNIKTNIIFADNINVDYIYLFNNSDKTLINEDRNIKLGINTKIKNHYCYLNGNIVLNIQHNLDSQAELDSQGVFLADGENRFSVQEKNYFSYPNAQGNFLVQGVAKDQAKASYYSSLIIEQAAKKTVAKLDMSAILLDSQAKINLVPALKVIQNDVKASHSAKISRLDKEQLFYLQSRGVSANEAEQLLLESMFEQFLARIPDKKTQEQIKNLLAKKLSWKK